MIFDEESENIKLHLSTVNLLSTCAKANQFCIEQTRLIIDEEVVYESLIMETIPFVMKKYYLRLFFEIYLNKEAKKVETLNLNDPRIIEFLKHGVLDDLRQYHLYFIGLIKRPIDELKRDTNLE